MNVGLWLLLHQTDGFAGDVHVVADVGLLVGGNRFEFLVESDFVAQVLDQFAQGEDGVGLQLLGADVIGDGGAGVGDRVCRSCRHVRSRICRHAPTRR